MNCMCAVFIILQNLSAASANHGQYYGTLAFLKSGADFSWHELWQNSSLSDTANVYRHMLSREQLFNDTGTYFRSPLIEQWTELEIVKAELNFFNNEGEWLANYLFEGMTSGDMAVDFFEMEYLQSNKNEVVQTNVSYGPSIYIHKSSDEAFFSLMSIKMAANLPLLTGAQFIISANDSFNYLTSKGGDADYVGCSRIPLLANTIDINQVFQCSYHCLTVSNCIYFGIFTNTSSGQTRHRCVPLGGMPAYTQDNCDTTCPDNRPCGKEYVDETSIQSVSADIYSMVAGVFSDLKAIQNATISLENVSLKIREESIIDLGTKLYIGGINVRGPGNYKLLLFRDSCEDMFDSDMQEYEDMYYGHHTGKVKIFETDTYHTFSPVLVRCLYFNSSTDLYERSADVSKVTNKFLLAEYLTVTAEWNKEECSDVEVMSRTDIIPDSAIIISQSPSEQLDFAHDENYTFPMESYGVVEIQFPGYTEARIKHLSVKASVKVTVAIEVQTHRLCTNLTNGQQSFVSLYGEVDITAVANTLTSVNFYHLKHSGARTFCADNFTITIAAVRPVTSTTFSFNLQLFGCRVDPGYMSTCQVQNLLDTYNAEVEGRLVPRPHLACNALRPGGSGLMLTDINSDVFVIINLSRYTAIEVKEVILAGTLMSANVDVGGDIQFGSAINGYPIEISFINARDYDVRIFDIHRDYSISSTTDYLQLTVEIYACVIANVSGPVTTDPQTTIYETVTTSEQTPIDPQTATSGSVTTSATSEQTPTDPQTATSDSVTTSATSEQTPTDPQTATSGSVTTSATSEQTTTDPQTATSDSVTTSTTSEQTTEATQMSTTHFQTTTSKTTPVSDPSPTSSTAIGTTTTTRRNNGDSNATPVPPPACRCWNQTKNLTSVELDAIVNEIVKNLTVPVDTTSSFRRTKMSMPDERQSSAVIGAVGIACMVSVAGAVVMMDIDHILKAIHFLKSLLSKNSH